MKRFDKGYIFYHLLTDFYISLVFTFAIASEFLTVTNEESGEVIAFNFYLIPLAIIIFAVLYASLSVYRVLYQRFSGYVLTENDIRCKRGVLFRKSSVIDYKKIHAINKKQNIFQKIFGVATLAVDSGSANTSHTAEITIFEKSAVVDSMLAELHGLRDGEKRTSTDEGTPELLLAENDPLYKFTSPKKFLYSLISITTSAFFISVFGLLAVILLGICKAILRLDFLGTLGQYAMWSLIILLGATLIVALLTFIGTVIMSFIGYYDFKIEKKDNDIIISYGLLVRHTNTFSYDRIRGVKITQGLIQRALGFAEIRLEVIGYMNEADNNAVTLGVLVPFCRYSEVDEILERILPEYKPEERKTSSPRLFPHLSWFTLILGISSSLVTLSTAVPMILLGAGALPIGIALSVIAIATSLIFLIKLGSAYLAHKTAGVAIGDKMITTYNGGYIKQITVMKSRDLSSVESVATPLQKKAGIASAVLHMRTNAMTNEVKVLHQEADTVNKLIENMPL